MEELITQFLEDEVTSITYSELWSFVRSNSILRGTFEGQRHIVMKISSGQFIIYKINIGMENTKYQPAVVVAKNYLLKKINSRAYDLKLPDIQNIFD
ncbi:hypothetical protein [Ruminococcus sp.]|uniref:hypothetical protein n=1 Tax=Ruminococcus sp. TaxID=41978 RepID=UPI0025FBEB3E|nr:hypothetical protein [Ruminococcus sp.]MBQ8965372.1 hypothetical protein [Ruminococcus sp.]